MSSQNSTYVINRRDIAAKMIDGEVILINLVNGVYYSLSGAGADVWQMIEQSGTTEQIVATLSQRYLLEGDAAREHVAALLASLTSEQIVAPHDATTGNGHFQLPDRCPAYTAPTLEVYRDMGDLLALDPPMPGLTPEPLG